MPTIAKVNYFRRKNLTNTVPSKIRKIKKIDPTRDKTHATTNDFLIIATSQTTAWHKMNERD